jgi:biopolymer transport protein ExbD
MPEINLVPMMDVLMTVLTFFIIVSMTFNAQQIAGINLPTTAGQGSQTQQANGGTQMVVGLDSRGRIIIGEQPLTTNQLAERIVQFLNQNPDGQIILKADRQLDFKTVQALLKTMRDIGGDRVSLSITQQG